MNKLIIDRKRWLTGQIQVSLGLDGTLLDGATGMMCCLGFACRQAGTPEDLLLGKEMPLAVWGRPNGVIPEGLVTIDPGEGVAQNSLLANALAAINDKLYDTDNGNTLSDADREAGVTEGFKTIGIEVVFEGEYPTNDEIVALRENIRRAGELDEDDEDDYDDYNGFLD